MIFKFVSGTELSLNDWETVDFILLDNKPRSVLCTWDSDNGKDDSATSGVFTVFSVSAGVLIPSLLEIKGKERTSHKIYT